MGDLILKLASGPEDESPYEALCDATSCHSLDSLTSGKSSDRDSGRLDSEAGKVSVLKHCCNHELPLEGGSAPWASWYLSVYWYTFLLPCMQPVTNFALLLFIYRRIEHSHISHMLVLLMKKRWAQRWQKKHKRDCAAFPPLLLLLQTCYTNSSADERRELVEEEEDHTYELLLTAQTKIPLSNPEPQSSKSTCV